MRPPRAPVAPSSCWQHPLATNFRADGWALPGHGAASIWVACAEIYLVWCVRSPQMTTATAIYFFHRYMSLQSYTDVDGFVRLVAS